LTVTLGKAGITSVIPITFQKMKSDKQRLAIF
jgi:hypothetical protein